MFGINWKGITGATITAVGGAVAGVIAIFDVGVSEKFTEVLGHIVTFGIGLGIFGVRDAQPRR